MNVGTVISFVIGGLLLLTVLTLNVNVRQYSYQSTVDVNTSMQVNEIRKFIMHDMQYWGFGEESQIELLTLEDNKLEFRALLGGDYNVISWEKSSDNYEGTQNPNDYALVREGPMDGLPPDEQIIFPVVRFFVQGFNDEKGTVPANALDEVNSISIEIMVESPYSSGTNPDGTASYSRSGWKKLFLSDTKMLGNIQ